MRESAGKEEKDNIFMRRLYWLASLFRMEKQKQKFTGALEEDAGRECSRLSFILAANLRQGNEKLLSLLAEEAETVLLEQRYRARKYGEEAGTKLLFPMLIMLLVVMFLILLPAMGSFKK